MGVRSNPLEPPLPTPLLVVDHAPPIIVARYDKALLWTTKKTILMRDRDLSTDSS